MSQKASTKPPSNMGSGFDKIYPGVSQKLAYDATAQSAALGARTSLVRLTPTTDCHVKIGANPVAIADGTCLFLKAGVIEYVGVNPGDKIAAIKDSAGGNLFITEGA